VTWTSGVVLWWLIFFMSLPIGVHSPHEVGEAVEPGNEAGAPVRPNLLIKVAASTVIAAALWGVAYWVISAGLISLRNG
jgi:predicted secreted protein